MHETQIEPVPIIGCDQALAIAYADAVEAYRDPLLRHRVEVRLEQNGWIVQFHFRPTRRFETGGGRRASGRRPPRSLPLKEKER